MKYKNDEITRLESCLDWRVPAKLGTLLQISKNKKKYQPSGEGGARSPPATPHRPQNPKWPPGGPKMAEGVWKGVYP